jgi:hypothetical protein
MKTGDATPKIHHFHLERSRNSGMRIIVNHLARVQPGYVFVAGLDIRTKAHIRPVQSYGRLSITTLLRNGGLFDVGSLVDLGAAQPVGNPPEIEDHLFDPQRVFRVRDTDPDEFWRLLSEVALPSLSGIFGADLVYRDGGYTIDVGGGQVALGCLSVPISPVLRVDRFNKIRVDFSDGDNPVDLVLTDLRFYHKDQQTPRQEVVADVGARLAAGVRAILSVGLGRPWQKQGDSQPRHWVQVNNIHLEDAPVWQECTF